MSFQGNRIAEVKSLSSLSSLTELNLRRNSISSIEGLERLPSLQRVFLSHNAIDCLYKIACVFQISYLIELSMDGNPVAEQDPLRYRNQIIAHIPSLKHLDLKRITEEERSLAIQSLNSGAMPLQLQISPLRREETKSMQEEEEEVEVEAKRVALLDLQGPDFVFPDNLSLATATRDRDLTASFLSPEKESEELPVSESLAMIQRVSTTALLPSVDSMMTAETPGQTSNNSQQQQAMAGNGPHLGGLVALAKAGRISKAQNLFDIEVDQSRLVYHLIPI